MEKGEVEAGVKIVNLLKAGKGATVNQYLFFSVVLLFQL